MHTVNLALCAHMHVYVLINVRFIVKLYDKYVFQITIINKYNTVFV